MVCGLQAYRGHAGTADPRDVSLERGLEVRERNAKRNASDVACQRELACQRFAVVAAVARRAAAKTAASRAGSISSVLTCVAVCSSRAGVCRLAVVATVSSAACAAAVAGVTAVGAAVTRVWIAWVVFAGFSLVVIGTRQCASWTFTTPR
jgi:hypothetical protein